MKFTKIKAGRYKAENGYLIKSNADVNIFTGRMMKANFWYVFNPDNVKIDGAPTFREAKWIVEKLSEQGEFHG